MKLKCIFMMLISIIIMTVNAIDILAFNDDNHNTLIIYPSIIDEDDLGLKVLDITVSHFSNSIDIVKTNSKIEDIDEYNYVIYYGIVEEKINSEVINRLEEYKGTLIGIGYNVEQIESKFSFMEYSDELTIDNITFKDKTHNLKTTEILRGIKTTKEGHILEKNHVNGKEIPWLIKNEQNNTFYFSFIDLYTELSIYFGEGLFECYDKQEARKEGQKLLRLEDITPTRNAKELMEVAEYLKEKEISYMAVVVPTYKDVENNKIYHLKDYPEIVKVLKYMQDNEGSIVMHGYSHQYRDSETGEGFEFWDSELDEPLENPNGVSEEEYIREKIEAGIDELVAHGLYPIAFEAPHYAISQNGYKIVSEYFSTYAGQIQLSDNTMNITYSPIYITKPTFLNGMTVIPENLGYLGENRFKQDLNYIKSNAIAYSEFSEGIIGVFYHPHLGVEKLKILVEALEYSMPNLEWFNLKSVKSTTKISNLKIEVNNGNITVEKSNVISPYQAKVYFEYAYIGVVLIILLFGLKYVFQIKLFNKHKNAK